MVEPLKSKTMTLKELQKATLKLIYQTKQQLRRKAWEVGMTDGEFEEKVLAVSYTHLTLPTNREV